MTDVKRFPLPHPIWLAIIGIVLGIVLAIAAYSLGRALRPAPVLRGAMLYPPVPAVDFRLRGSDGKNYSLYDFQSAPVLLSFTCSNCSRSGALLEVLAQARDLAINDGNEIQVIVISIDPEMGLPELDVGFLGLSGDPREISDLAHSYDIYFHSSPISDGTDPRVDITPLIMLIDKQGYWRAVYPLTMAAEDIAADIQVLLEEE